MIVAQRQWLVRRAGHAQYRNAGAENRKHLGNLLPAEPGHGQVGDNQLDIAMGLNVPQRCFAVLCLQDIIPGLPQRARAEMADNEVVLCN